MSAGKKRKEKSRLDYFFFRYGKPVLLFIPTLYPGGKSQGFPLFGFFLLKKYTLSGKGK